MIPTPAGGSAATKMNRIFGTARIDRQSILSMVVNPRPHQRWGLPQVWG
ncbi:MAG: hypothetical protein HYU33_05160 [Candidatus Omnitrophica bacterium]|nr:hypothetical protein [Candidatus Omnitrophota bacterium]MBI3009477.1 hypothetical protein [Candidatus Omnitrophota bacterium]